MALTQPAAEALEYHERPDEDLVSAAKSGDNLAMEFLLNKYKNFVRIKAKSYFLIGADREDIIQEGMIGLYKAVRDFKADKLSSFRAFAELCITRQIITAIKTATRQKHIPLNQNISLNKPIYDEDSERTLLDVMPSQKTSDPEELVINQEVSEDIKARIQENLSDLESQVLLSYLEGKSYQEMARDLNRHVKSIDNALQRVKRKVGQHLAKRGLIRLRPDPRRRRLTDQLRAPRAFQGSSISARFFSIFRFTRWSALSIDFTCRFKSRAISWYDLPSR